MKKILALFKKIFSRKKKFIPVGPIEFKLTDEDKAKIEKENKEFLKSLTNEVEVKL